MSNDNINEWNSQFIKKITKKKNAIERIKAVISITYTHSEKIKTTIVMNGKFENEVRNLTELYDYEGITDFKTIYGMNVIIDDDGLKEDFIII